MGWEERKRGGHYYTRSRRVDGQVLKEYIGAGPLAQIAAERDALDRRQREEEASAWRAECERLEALEEPVEELCEVADLLARATLLAAGYHQHHRGEWRKRRGSKTPE
jgi:hypothetical protein